MNNGLSMIFVTAMVVLASTAIANQFWLERDARLHFGEPVGNLRESGGAMLNGITGPRVFATGPSAAPRLTRRDDHVTWTAP